LEVKESRRERKDREAEKARAIDSEMPHVNRREKPGLVIGWQLRVYLRVVFTVSPYSRPYRPRHSSHIIRAFSLGERKENYQLSSRLGPLWGFASLS
jgi:hypothetical protein